MVVNYSLKPPYCCLLWYELHNLVQIFVNTLLALTRLKPLYNNVLSQSIIVSVHNSQT